MNPGPGYYENADTPLLNFVARDTSKDMVQAVNVQCFGTTLKRFDDHMQTKTPGPGAYIKLEEQKDNKVSYYFKSGERFKPEPI